MNPTDLARAGFAVAWTSTAGDAPMSRRTQATCLVLQDAVGLPADDLILEAGRTEGHRDRREADHATLYDYHSANLAKALKPILGASTPPTSHARPSSTPRQPRRPA